MIQIDLSIGTIRGYLFTETIFKAMAFRAGRLPFCLLLCLFVCNFVLFCRLEREEREKGFGGEFSKSCAKFTLATGREDEEEEEKERGREREGKREREEEGQSSLGVLFELSWTS